MGLFRKSDELFEIMARQRGGGAPAALPSSTVTSRPVTRRFGRKSELAEDLFEVDGDALVVVEDGWLQNLAAEGEEVPTVTRTFSLRSDTAVVGAFLGVGLLVAAFLVGRGSVDEVAGPEATSEVTSSIVDLSETEAQDDEQAESSETQPQVNRRSSPMQAGFSRDRTARPRQASTPRQPVPRGKFVLAVCTTSPTNAKRLAKWLNTDGRSPIFGRPLQAYTRRGQVRIRGFLKEDQAMLDKVHQTSDPFGSSTFSDALYMSR